MLFSSRKRNLPEGVASVHAELFAGKLNNGEVPGRSKSRSGLTSGRAIKIRKVRAGRTGLEAFPKAPENLSASFQLERERERKSSRKISAII